MKKRKISYYTHFFKTSSTFHLIPFVSLAIHREDYGFEKNYALHFGAYFACFRFVFGIRLEEV